MFFFFCIYFLIVNSHVIYVPLCMLITYEFMHLFLLIRSEMLQYFLWMDTAILPARKQQAVVIKYGSYLLISINRNVPMRIISHINSRSLNCIQWVILLTDATLNSEMCIINWMHYRCRVFLIAAYFSLLLSTMQ